jgi:hypothetical protein
MLNNNIIFLILTYNEELHLQRCLDSAKKVSNNILIIDSFSDDKTLKIIKNNNVDYIQNKWSGYANQLNFGINKIKELFSNESYIFRLDADEYLTENLQKKLINIDLQYDGYLIKRRYIFLNKEIKHGMTYPNNVLRLFKLNKGRCESKHMDEHIVIQGTIYKKPLGDIFDENLNDITWWIEKHLRYAKNELSDHCKISNISTTDYKLSLNAHIKRIFKIKIYYNTPIFIRALILFIIRYFLALGFLDGKQGLIYHFLQSLFYRNLVDILIYEKNINNN